MSIFKNKVGRPSNEVKKKRRIFYISTICVASLLICVCVLYSLKYFKDVEGNGKKATVYVDMNLYFPDSVFRRCVSNTYYNKYKSTRVELSKLKKLTTLSCSSFDSYAGLEYLTGLTEVSFTSYHFTKIGFYKNTKLKKIYLYQPYDPPSSLYSNNDPKAKKLTNVDVTFNEELEDLSIKNNSLTSINLSYNKKLKTLVLQDNKLSSINISKNTKLETLNLSGNALTSIELSNNKKLKTLVLQDNKIHYIYLGYSTKLETLNLSGNGLKEIALNNNTNLKNLNLSHNNIDYINVMSNKKLESLDLTYNKLAYINLCYNTKLKKAYLLTGNPNLKYSNISICKNKITIY